MSLERKQTETDREYHARLQSFMAASSECDLLTKNPCASGMTRREARDRITYLIQKMSALKSGYSADEVLHKEIELLESRYDLRRTQPVRHLLTDEERAERAVWGAYIRSGLNGVKMEMEKRVGQVGQPQIQTTSFGAFVPVSWLAQLFQSLKDYDPVFDPNFVSYVRVSRGGLIQVPLMADTDENAAPVGEGAADSAQDIQLTGQLDLHPKNYSTPNYVLSIEAAQDIFQAPVDGSIDEVSGMSPEAFFQAFCLERVARGVGADLVAGSGSGGHILGLISQLEAASIYAIGRTAVGSQENDGNAGHTGANSIGSSDLFALFSSVPQRYRKSPKCAWLMNSNTAQSIMALKDTVGRPLGLLKGDDEDDLTLFGRRVGISPSMPSIGPSATPVLFGDFSRFIVCNASPLAYIKRYDEAPGLIEYGNVALRMFVRFDGGLAWIGQSATALPPLSLLQNHS